MSPCTDASLCGLLPAKSGLTERQTIFCLVSHSVSDELEFPVLQRPDRQFMGKQAVCFQIGGQHFHGQCDRSVLVRLTGRHFRLDHVITQKYIIIGLGNYGGGLAEELMAIGHEVIGVDQNEGRVDNLKDKITTAFVLDATDELALETLPLREIDVVIVAIGENFGASVRVVALLKQKKVKHIFARAIDSVHKAILEAFAIDKVLTPEKDAAREFVQFLALGIHAESFRVDEDYYVIKFKVPRKCAGYPLSGMNLEEDFHLKLIALKQAAEVKNILGMKKLTKEVMTVIPDNYLLKEEDELVCYGLYKDFQALWKAF